MNVKIKLIDGGKMPYKATEGAACYDLCARKIIEVTPFYKIVKLGICTEIPEGYRMPVYPRSSLSKTGWILANSVGIIDSDYRGEWQLHLRYASSAGFYEEYDIDGKIKRTPMHIFPYRVGERCAQTCIEEVIPLQFTQVNELSETTRGTGGHGHTGK